MTGYKLTDQNMQTYGGYQWTIGEERCMSGKGTLCGPGWLHYYRSPLLALLHNPIHANISKPRLWRVKTGGRRKHDGFMKSGCTRLILVEELFLPTITTTQRVAYGILCAQKVCTDKPWCTWAANWLNGTDRTKEAAREAWSASWVAARRSTAMAAMRAASARWAAYAAWTTQMTAWSAAYAAGAAASVRAARPKVVSRPLPLRSLARQAMEVQ